MYLCRARLDDICIYILSCHCHRKIRHFIRIEQDRPVWRVLRHGLFPVCSLSGRILSVARVKVRVFYVAEVYAIPFLVIDFAVGGYLGNFSFLLSSIYVKFAHYIP